MCRVFGRKGTGKSCRVHIFCCWISKQRREKESRKSDTRLWWCVEMVEHAGVMLRYDAGSSTRKHLWQCPRCYFVHDSLTTISNEKLDTINSKTLGNLSPITLALSWWLTLLCGCKFDLRHHHACSAPQDCLVNLKRTFQNC